MEDGEVMAEVAGHVRRPTPEHELNGLNFDETDSRHNRATHQGWTPVDGNSGPMNEETWEKSGDFPDGPGPWRQT